MKSKKLVALLLSLICVFTLASCKDCNDKQPSNDGKPTSTATNEKVIFYYDIDNDGQNNELVFYHYEDEEEWMKCINEINIEEIFDGMMFAG